MSLTNHSINPLTIEDLNDLTVSTNVTTAGNGYAYSTTPGLTIGGFNGTSANAVWTTTGTGTGTLWNHSAVGAVQVTPKATIALKGEDADIDLNGKSLKTWMEKVEERLNILTPNPELEKEWDELRKLGERYRKLEKKCKEKAEVWKRLSAKQPKD